MHDLIEKLDKGIKWSFYIILFLVPLVMHPNTYELFEFNKMWLVFIMSTVILFLWGMKMIAKGKIEIRRTPLDIPLALFLLSQIVSTVFSIEPHVSFWGYYSRFNGGLLSTLSYIFLYYAFVTNLVSSPDARENNEKPISYKMVIVSLLSGLAVSLWGLPSHFGADPTCFMFRGQLDVACWTPQFQPTIRMFSTLGQPNWLGTFLAALVPISLGMGLIKLKDNPKNIVTPILYLLLTLLFFADLLWSRSQSSFLGLGTGMAFFFVFGIFTIFRKTDESVENFFKQKTSRFLLLSVVLLFIIFFFIGTDINAFKILTLDGVKNALPKQSQTVNKKENTTAAPQGFADSPTIVGGGTESSQIRLIVWRGALDIFKQHPLFGTGTETFAYAYYKVKPQEHNLTSEWDYLYNKAHNEYLNYLATTGIFGLGSYLLIIALFLFVAIKTLLKKSIKEAFLLIGIVGGFLAIIVSNFFGFSVVILNLFFFLFPAFFFDLSKNKSLNHMYSMPNKEDDLNSKMGNGRMTLIVLLAILCLYFLFYLANFWFADMQYALGSNLNKAGEFTQAYTPLQNSVNMLPGEDTYKDELSINLATLAVLLQQNSRATDAAQFAQRAQALSDDIISRHPNNLPFFKTRIRVEYALAQLQPQLINEAIKSADYARTLAPTDAKLAYNEALFYSQKNDNAKMLQFLDLAEKLKPNYTDPYYAEALMYQQMAKDTPSKADEYNAKAKNNLEYILKNIDPSNKQVKDLLDKLQ
ncbi:MAG TPA: O-antigen ligase family protein [Patescibacteria group bacterium]|nr:O-antigen ligase family protein [Patescibacteria group bacterium]